MNDLMEYMIGTIKNDDIRDFAIKCVNTIPEYWYKVPASSTGKYHPQYALGEGGLARHTCALIKILNHILDVECIGKEFNDREKDLLRVACIMHDSRKSGSEEEYSKDKYTKFDHPLLAAREIKDIDGLDIDEKKIIISAIASHMGEWNMNKDRTVILPLPNSKYQKIVHLVDYIASRKDIEILF